MRLLNSNGRDDFAFIQVAAAHETRNHRSPVPDGVALSGRLDRDDSRRPDLEHRRVLSKHIPEGCPAWRDCRGELIGVNLNRVN